LKLERLRKEAEKAAKDENRYVLPAPLYGGFFF
jgi:hypothetical protein